MDLLLTIYFMQISKSVEYKNIHIRISFRVEVTHMSICVHEPRCSIFLRTKLSVG